MNSKYIMNAKGEDLKNIIYSFLNCIVDLRQVASDGNVPADLLTELNSSYSVIELLSKFPVNEGLTLSKRYTIRETMQCVLDESMAYVVDPEAFFVKM